MKNISLIATLVMTLATSAFAEGGDMGGGLATKSITLRTSEVEAFIANSGDYITVSDIQTGYESIKGLEITDQKTIFEFSSTSKVIIESIIMKNGRELQLKMKTDGGDMGGG